MSFFCPYCANLLSPEKTATGMSFTCRLCPISFPVTKPIRIRTVMEHKKTEDVVYTEADALRNCEETSVNCPNCDNRRAYFVQMQTRSADEPMTIFYRCTNSDCKHTWRD